jgi:hypothetical protein
MVRSLRAALARLNCIRPELCWEYLKAWSADQEKWRLYLDGLPAGQPLEDAVEAVRRLGVSVLLRRPRHKPVTRSSLELEVWRYGSRPGARHAVAHRCPVRWPGGGPGRSCRRP